jgi:peroxiredoxin Q/BCP
MLSWLFARPLEPGGAAPDFTLADDSGGTVSLAALRGRPALLVFYPRDNTPGCTAQLCELRDNYAALQAAGVAVYGVNPQSAASHAGFRARQRYPFPLLVDTGQRVARLYHASGPAPRRTVYLIGPDGVIRFAKRGAPPSREILAALG